MSKSRLFSLGCLIMAAFFLALYGVDQLIPAGGPELELLGEALKSRS